MKSKSGLTQNDLSSINLREFSLIVLKFVWIGEDTCAARRRNRWRMLFGVLRKSYK